MKKALIFIIVFCASSLHAQITDIHENGLAYSDTTMSKLKHIVDSLHTHQLNREFTGVPQAFGHYIYLRGSKAIKAYEYLQQNPSFEEFVDKFNAKGAQKKVRIAKSTDSIDGKWHIRYHEVNTTPLYLQIILGTTITVEEELKTYQHQWVFNYSSSPKGNEFLKAFFFTEEFKSDPIPLAYAGMIQYVDLLVDTSQYFFAENAMTHSRLQKEKEISPFEEYADRQVGQDANALQKLEKLKKQDEATFMQLIQESATGAKQGKYRTTEKLEECVEHFLSKKDALALKRCRIVTRYCGNDNYPFHHTMEIARLSAESVSWELFLRTHLDMMNRTHGGPSMIYARSGRNTHLKEFEALGINIHDLLLGTALKASNTSKNHYASNIDRLGRALPELSNLSLIESKMLEMIGNSSLDDFNRMQIYALYKCYAQSLSDDKEKEALRKLRMVEAELPDYLVK